MANIVNQARKDIRYLSSLVRGLIALDEELEKIGSLERMSAERQQDLKKVEAEVAAKAGELASVVAEIAAANKSKADAIAAKVEAERSFEKSKELTAQAANNIVEDARRAAQKIIDDANSLTAAHNKEAAGAAEHLARIKLEVDQASGALSGIKSEIAKIKAKF